MLISSALVRMKPFGEFKEMLSTSWHQEKFESTCVGFKSSSVKKIRYFGYISISISSISISVSMYVLQKMKTYNRYKFYLRDIF